MRHRRVKDDASGSAPDNEPGIGGWVLVIAAICAVWLAAMVAISHLGLKYKTPERIEHWQPERMEKAR